MSKEIMCTLGPASMNERVLLRLEALGVSLFRVNLSHTELADVGSVVDYVQGHTRVPLCLDTEGAQIRTGPLAEGKVVVRDNSIVRVLREPVSGDSRGFNFYPADIVARLEVGDFISIDFNAVLVQVIDLEPDGAVMRVLNGGEFGANKAVTLERPFDMPPLTEKDRAALKIGREKGIRHVALSFANRGSDLDAIRRLSGPEAFVIAKIECRNALANLDEIARKSDALLIDRGDLSRELPIERIPALQKWIVRRSKEMGRKVYVATNLLESMVSAPGPTRAEVNDVFNSLLDGVDGLVLAAETAIGANPVGCASMIVKLIKEFETGAHMEVDSSNLGYSDLASGSLLVAPHGGALVHREARMPTEELDRLKRLTVSERVLMDCEQIAVGTYSPVTGFMDRETLESVLETNRLPGGVAWPMPIILQLDDGAVAGVGPGERVALASASGTVHALLEVTSIYPVRCDSVAERWFGTTSRDHPGVALLAQGGGWLVSGEVVLVDRLPSAYRHYELTPAQARSIFTRKGWDRVVGFHTRNVIHRAHEHIQLKALEESGADGLLISPVIGPKKPGDFRSESIVKSYQLMMDLRLYPPGKVVLGSLATYPRYSGPREAVFTALCRKNLGCSHFIVGRDHAGVGRFYEAEETRALFDELGDLGITPLFFDAVGYNPETDRYEAVNDSETLEMISGSEMRAALRENRSLPDWFMRETIQDMLRAELAAGRPVFCE